MATSMRRTGTGRILGSGRAGALRATPQKANDHPEDSVQQNHQHINGRQSNKNAKPFHECNAFESSIQEEWGHHVVY